MSDPAIKIIVDVVNDAAIKRLTKEIEDQKKVIVETTAAMHAFEISEEAAGQKMLVAAEKIQKANSSLRELKTSSGMSAQGVLQLGYAIDDLQYGLSAIVNNIPQVAVGLGLGAGIAGAVGIAAVAVSQLVSHWDQLSSVLEANWSGKTAEELMKIKENAEAGAAAFDKLREAKTEYEKASSEVITKGIGGDQAAPAAAQAVAAALARSGKGEQGDYTTDVLGAPPGFEWLGRLIDKATGRKNAGEKNLDKAQQLLGLYSAGGEAGRQAGEQLRELAKNDPELRAQIGDVLNKANPDELKEVARLNKESKDNEKAYDKRKAAADKEKAKTEALNIQGQEGQELMNRQIEKNKKEERDAEFRRDRNSLQDPLRSHCGRNQWRSGHHQPQRCAGQGQWCGSLRLRS